MTKQTENLTTDAFINALFRADDLIEFRPIETWEDNNGKKHSTPLPDYRRWVKASKWASLLPMLKECNKLHDGNIFFGVNPRPANNAGSQDDIALCRSLWIDIDHVSPDEFNKRIDGLKLPTPNIVINSGHGIHAYWLLESPYHILCESDREAIKATVGNLLEAIGGPKMRGTQDVSRILRLPHPDLMNVKNARNSQTPTPVTLLRCESEPRITLEAMNALLPDAKPSKETIKQPKHAGNGHAKTWTNNKRIMDILGRLDETTDDRSTRDYAACCEFIRDHVSKDDAWALVENKSKFADRGYKYFSDTWDAAHATYADNKPRIVCNTFISPEPPVASKGFPFMSLPSPVREIVEEVTRVYGGDGGAAALWSLITISGSTGNLARIHHARIDNLPIHLFGILVGDSGSNKTISGKDIVKPLKEAQTAVTEDFNKRKVNSKGNLKTLNAQIVGLQNKVQSMAVKGDAFNTASYAAQLAGFETEKQTLQDNLKGGSWIVDDVTPEKLLCKMAVSYDRAAFLSSESRGIQNILGQSYSTGSSISVLTKSWDGEVLQRDRIGDKDEVNTTTIVHVPSVSLCATYTTALFDHALRNAEFRNSGFLSRCLLVSLLPVRRQYKNDGGCNSAIVAKWNDLISMLATIPVPQDCNGHVAPPLLGIETEAYKHFILICQQISDKAFNNRDALSEDFLQWINRFELQLLRIAGLFHLVRYCAEYALHEIGLDDINRAYECLNYFASQFFSVMDKREQAAADNNLIRLMNWASKRKPFRKSDANRGLRFGGDGKAAEICSAVLAEALSKGWLDYNTVTCFYSVTKQYKQHTSGTTAKGK